MALDWRRLIPGYWFQNYPTSKAWDRELNEALDLWCPSDITNYTCQIGPFCVWIGNWPIAYGKLYLPEMHLLPTVATRHRLRHEIIEAMFCKLLAETKAEDWRSYRGKRRPTEPEAA